MRLYFIRIGIALSVLFNVILGGSSNQTFSARNWQWKREGRRNLTSCIDKLFFFDPDHCLECWVHWKVRTIASKEYIEIMMEKTKHDAIRFGEGDRH